LPVGARTSADEGPAAAGTKSTVIRLGGQGSDSVRVTREEASLGESGCAEGRANRAHGLSSKTAVNKQAALLAVHEDGQHMDEESAGDDEGGHRWPTLQQGKHAQRSSQMRQPAADDDHRGRDGWAEEAEPQLAPAAGQQRRRRAGPSQEFAEEEEMDPEGYGRSPNKGKQLPKSLKTAAAEGGYDGEDGYSALTNGFRVKGRASVEEALPPQLLERNEAGSDGGFEEASTYVDGWEPAGSDRQEHTSNLAEGENICCDWRSVFN